jgi:histidinol-phosphate aminotransferase
MTWKRHLRPTLAALSIYDVEPAPSTTAARLHANECPMPWPADAMEALAEVVRQLELNRYPDTSGRSLRAALAERHGCSADRIVLGNGSDEIISIILTAFSGGEHPGALVIPTPTFVMYAHSAAVLGIPIREVALADDLSLDAEAMHAALGGASTCFLARPNNPTSSSFDADVVHELVAAHPDVVFVLDEAYAAYSDAPPIWIADGPENLVLMTTLSKVGLAALRVGYAVAPTEMARAFNKVRHPYNVSATSLALAEMAITRFAPAQAEMIRSSVDSRARLAEILGRVTGATVFESHGNMVLARVPAAIGATSLVAGLAARDVRVKDVSGVPGLAGCIRVSAGTPDELSALEAALNALGVLDAPDES